MIHQDKAEKDEMVQASPPQRCTVLVLKSLPTETL